MFFVLSKVAGFFVHPSNFFFALALAGIALIPTRFVRTGSRCLIAAVALTGVAGFSPLGNLLIYPLEQRFPAWQDSGAPPVGIIVQGGALNPDVSQARGQSALNEAAERLTVVATLARRYPDARIVYSGGNNNLITDGAPEAQFVLSLFESFGIARSRILLEERARNTVENAVFTKALVHPKPGERWLLVTTAHHMPRSVGVFRKAGFDVEPCPVDWRTASAQDLFAPFALLSDGLKRTDTAVHEWLGLFAYWLAGATSSLFPAPR